MSAASATSAGEEAARTAASRRGGVEAVVGRIEPFAGLEPARPDHEVHAEGLGAPGHLLADVAEAEQAERRARTGPRAFEYSFLFQCPARRSATLSGIRRSSERIRPKVSSATAIAFLPGQFDT